jgi:protein involved in polysaccharide export with SLBB domain
VKAQPLQEQSRFNRAAYYSYSEPGDVTIQVYVWGNVRHPGLYQVAKETGLSELFSLVGGPSIKTTGRWTNRTLYGTKKPGTADGTRGKAD